MNKIIRKIVRSRWHLGLALMVGIALAVTGCGAKPQPAKVTAKKVQTKTVKKPTKPVAGGNKDTEGKRVVQVPPSPSIADEQPDKPNEKDPPKQPRSSPGTLTDLVKQGEELEFALPEINDAKAAAAGIRKLTGKHITIYTDVPAAEDVDELPRVFDLAIAPWCQYFGVEEAQLASWKVVGYLLKDQQRFAGAGLYPNNLPDFTNGFQRGSEFWWFDQPSPYYRRHLMLHEGTHAFMTRHLRGAGPPWYMEGTAELLGTHQWSEGKLTLGYNPASKEEVPFWGRVKIIRDEYAAQRGMLLTDIMKYDAHAHLKNEPYGWCWGAAAFFDSHPLTRKAFRELPKSASDRSIDFSRKFHEQLQADWPAILEDWQLFILNCDYGYDFARSSVVRKAEVTAIPAAGATVTVAADRGWQSTGLKVEAGKTYSLSATGRYQVAQKPKPWPCEPGGVTIHYHQNWPLGMLIASVGDVENPTQPVTPLSRFSTVGTATELGPDSSGTLYLCINEASSGLADNQGSLSVKITPQAK